MWERKAVCRELGLVLFFFTSLSSLFEFAPHWGISWHPLMHACFSLKTRWFYQVGKQQSDLCAMAIKSKHTEKKILDLHALLFGWHPHWVIHTDRRPALNKNGFCRFPWAFPSIPNWMFKHSLQLYSQDEKQLMFKWIYLWSHEGSCNKVSVQGDKAGSMWLCLRGNSWNREPDARNYLWFNSSLKVKQQTHFEGGIKKKRKPSDVIESLLRIIFLAALLFLHSHCWDVLFLQLFRK